MISTFLFQEVKKNAIRIHFLFCYTTIKKLQGNKHKNANVRHKYYTEKNSSMIEKKFPTLPNKNFPKKTHVLLTKSKAISYQKKDTLISKIHAFEYPKTCL